MKIEETNIAGLFLIEALRFEDLRGELIKPFNFDQYSRLDVNLDFKETWFTKSKKDVIRAMHLQIEEMACEKLVSVINGSVIDVVLDLRPNSETYGNYFEIELNDKTPKALYIPQGCAHGYRVLENNTITMYKATKVHSEKHDLGIKWDSFGYDWNIKNPILSDKDLNLIEFKDYK
jgi:dTDP-4-dehydrorhamnose 3,5-epimerase/CDP-3, 6-dideoxy-D-glycero-D-glycero-4-hexulose-5-epimerase